MRRYVALGSSMAAGPGIAPRVPGSPRAAGRSARNYAHLVAADLGLDLVDVTYSGATTAHLLAESQRGVPPQLEALDGSEELVTVTIGGNDAGYVPLLYAAGLPYPVRWVPLLGKWIRGLLDPSARYIALSEVAGALVDVGRGICERAPSATVLFVDYLTLLPPERGGTPYGADEFALGRHVGAALEGATAEAASATGCGVVRAGAASRDHHGWSAQPWTTPFGLPLPGRAAPLHPTAAGMRAVADLIVAAVRA